MQEHDLHPDFPGPPQVRELLSGFWPFTVGRRVTLGALQVLSLVLFGLAASLPIQVGSLLSTALGRQSDEQALQTYVLDPQSTRLHSLSAINGNAMTSEQQHIAADAIDAFEAQSLAASAESLIAKLYTDGTVYRSRSLALIDEPTKPWEQLVARLAADGSISRAELDNLRTTVLGTAPPPAEHVVSAADEGRAFVYLTRSLLSDPGARAARAHAHDARFRALLLRLGATILAVLALRMASLRLTQRGVQFAGRHLQDAVFTRIHDTALVDAYALAKPSMVSRCTSYIERTTTAVTRLLTVGVPSIAALLLSVSLLIWIDRWIGLIVVGFVALFEVIRRFISPSWSRHAHERFDLATELSEITDRTIQESPDARALHVEARARGSFAAQADRVVRHSRRVETFAELFHLSAFTLGQFAVLTAIAVVGYVRHDLTLAEAAAVVLYVREVTSALDALPGLIVELQEAAPAMRRLRRVLAAPLRGGLVAGDLNPNGTSLGIRIDRATLSVRPDREPIDGISLDFHEGFHFLIGTHRNVIGIIDAVAGLEQIDDGRIDIEGRAIYVSRRPLVVFGTILDNLTLLRPEVASSIPDEIDLQSLLEVARRWGLDRAWSVNHPDDLQRTVGHHRFPIPDEVRARLGFARVELANPDIVLIDDPTPGLPDAIASEIWAMVRTVFGDRCVLATTERLDVIKPDDEVVTIRHGHTVESGDREHLLAAGAGFARLWSQYITGGPNLARLGAVPLLADLDESTLNTLSNRLVTEHFEAGEPIFAPGDRADRLFIVVDGEVAISHHEHDLATVGRGQHFGDLSTDDTHELRRHGARALTPTVLQSLHRNSISAGVAGVLDLSAAHRQVFAQLARSGEQPLDDLVSATSHSADVVVGVIAELVSKGLVRRGVSERGITYRVAATQSRRVTGSATLQLLHDVQQSTQ